MINKSQWLFDTINRPEEDITTFFNLREAHEALLPGQRLLDRVMSRFDNYLLNQRFDINQASPLQREAIQNDIKDENTQNAILKQLDDNTECLISKEVIQKDQYYKLCFSNIPHPVSFESYKIYRQQFPNICCICQNNIISSVYKNSSK